MYKHYYKKIKLQKKNNDGKKSEEITKFTNQLIDKINKNIEKFNYNVIIANIYETYNFFNEKINESIDNNNLFENGIINWKRLENLLSNASKQKEINI